MNFDYLKNIITDNFKDNLQKYMKKDILISKIINPMVNKFKFTSIFISIVIINIIIYLIFNVLNIVSIYNIYNLDIDNIKDIEKFLIISLTLIVNILYSILLTALLIYILIVTNNNLKYICIFFIIYYIFVIGYSIYFIYLFGKLKETTFMKNNKEITTIIIDNNLRFHLKAFFVLSIINYIVLILLSILYLFCN
jgi:hypothetical protein